MILKELHLTDALGRISIFSPLTHNGEVRILTWPQVIDISKIRDIQFVGTSGLIKFWKLEKILLRTVAVARAYTFLEVRSRDSTWWPDLMWPRHKNFSTDVKLINEKVCQVWLRCSVSVFELSSKNHRGGGPKWPPPPPGRRLSKISTSSVFLATSITRYIGFWISMGDFVWSKIRKSFSGHMTSLTFDDPMVSWTHFKSP